MLPPHTDDGFDPDLLIVGDAAEAYAMQDLPLMDGLTGTLTPGIG